MKVATAGQCVNSASSAMAGSSSSQPWMVAVRREVMCRSLVRHGRASPRHPRLLAVSDDVDAQYKAGHDEDLVHRYGFSIRSASACASFIACSDDLVPVS